MSELSAPSSFPTFPADKPLLPQVWCFRVLSSLALLSLILAQTAFRSSSAHDFLIGFPTGLLLVLVIVSFLTQNVTFRANASRPEATLDKTSS